ncbi:hypothetical protein Cgig2_016357 [Carnegiea gigantea]|uniref:Uncharacterized protein n=1 Tax=Carnegiea gigantea TaxID=171969 RepID=A0A9Q1Q829_9CARY|nr:hypothetical protein Cgig2_016357 [Carnegiea gigantea]
MESRASNYCRIEIRATIRIDAEIANEFFGLPRLRKSCFRGALVVIRGQECVVYVYMNNSVFLLRKVIIRCTRKRKRLQWGQSYRMSFGDHKIQVLNYNGGQSYRISFGDHKIQVLSIGSNVHSLWFNWILTELTNKRFKEFFGPNQSLVYRLNRPVQPECTHRIEEDR